MYTLSMYMHTQTLTDRQTDRQAGRQTGRHRQELFQGLLPVSAVGPVSAAACVLSAA